MGVHHVEEEVGGARPAIAGSGRPALTWEQRARAVLTGTRRVFKIGEGSC
jgi:hypothetical protein